MSRFEPWTRGPLTGISSSRIAPGLVRIGVVVCLVLLVIGFGALKVRPFQRGLTLVGLYGLMALFLRTWLVVTARTRQWLVARSDWGDVPEDSRPWRRFSLGSFWSALSLARPSYSSSPRWTNSRAGAHLSPILRVVMTPSLSRLPKSSALLSVQSSKSSAVKSPERRWSATRHPGQRPHRPDVRAGRGARSRRRPSQQHLFSRGRTRSP